MKPKALIPIMLIFMLSVSACGPDRGVQPTRTPAPVETPVAVDPGLNLLVMADGEVQLKREGWPDYHPTAFGAVLHRGDQLRPANGARATVLCDGLTTWTVPAGVPSGLTNGCPPPPEPALVRRESAIGSTRGGSDPLIPYVISPRKTQLLNGTPTLRWNSVPGVTRYTVHVRGEGVDWRIQVSETEVVYPGEPSLEPGATYLLIVEADNGKSSQDEGVAGLGFSLLDENEAQRVSAAAGELTGLGLADEAEAFALAQLYAGHGLTAEAIKTLKALADGGSQAAAVYRRLGDLYGQVELSLLAEERYLEAIELAEDAGDVEGLATAQAGLGEVYAALGQNSEVIRWLSEAQTGYEVLGDTQRANELAERLTELNQ